MGQNEVLYVSSFYYVHEMTNLQTFVFKWNWTFLSAQWIFLRVDLKQFLYMALHFVLRIWLLTQIVTVVGRISQPLRTRSFHSSSTGIRGKSLTFICLMYFWVSFPRGFHTLSSKESWNNDRKTDLFISISVDKKEVRRSCFSWFAFATIRSFM